MLACQVPEDDNKKPNEQAEPESAEQQAAPDQKSQRPGQLNVATLPLQPEGQEGSPSSREGDMSHLDMYSSAI